MAESDVSDPRDRVPAAYSEGGYRGRTVVITVVVCALVWWLSSATGVKIYAVVAIAAAIVLGGSMMQATFIEYAFILLMWLIIGVVLRFSGHPEFLWPSVSACIVAALNGMGGRETRMAWMHHVATKQREEK
ncbi:MAG TPA: hypothetical protein VIT83_00800 [Gammaproteobacteria bacterium]